MQLAVDGADARPLVSPDLLIARVVAQGVPGAVVLPQRGKEAQRRTVERVTRAAASAARSVAWGQDEALCQGMVQKRGAGPFLFFPILLTA